MCGRYASARKRIELLEEFSVQRDQVAELLKPDYNVAPTKAVYTVVDRAARPAGEEAVSADGDASRDASTGVPERELRVMRWGLVPFWAKDVKIGSRMINARAETVAEKPAFRRAFAKRRCLMPADGYYEWQQLPGAAKQPVYISRKDGRSLAFAGLYELWRDPAVRPDDQDAWLWTNTIITTSAPDEIGMIHDRMPMIIDQGSWADWLDPANNDVADLKTLLTPAMVGDLTTWPVSTAVNAVRNNGPELIEPVPAGLAGPLTAVAPRAGRSAAATQGARDLGDDGTGALF
ncbi:MAG TPA: SOS response-associated peptidase [Streptosporangiaceae bacterium]|nr:SOS response-associated peptidase [Streptosporangiaceae bacterium]